MTRGAQRRSTRGTAADLGPDSTPGTPMLHGLVTFAHELRAAGLDVGSGQLQDAVRALAAVDAHDREAVYWAWRCALCTDRDQLERFDAAFGAFAAAATREGSSEAADELSLGLPAHGRDGGVGDPAAAESDPLAAGHGATARERLLDRDFAAYDPAEVLEARRLVRRLARSLPVRRSRRREPARRGARLDLRRTLQRAMRTEGEPLERAWERPGEAARPVVFLLDVSGSMEAYARPMLMFAQAARAASRRVEVFAFGTRVTRLTAHLTGGDLDRVLGRAAGAVPDWAGGTRIGASLEAFNDEWGRRGTTRGAVVVIASDGWETGDPGALGEEMERLHRAAHRVVWATPSAGDPDYEPLTRGMLAALPWIDALLAGHSLRAMGDLAVALDG